MGAAVQSGCSVLGGCALGGVCHRKTAKAPLAVQPNHNRGFCRAVQLRVCFDSC